MRFAIPSYNRPQILIKKTIPTLLKLGVDYSDIDLFLYDDEQVELYSDVRDINIIKTDILDLGDRLNYILCEHYPVDTEVVLIEDDINSIRKGGTIKGKEDVDKDFFEKGFEITRNEGKHLWGISPTDSYLFQKPGYTTDFRFIIGTLYGVITSNTPALKVSITYKQDFERSILYYKMDKGMVRFNDVFCRTAYRAKGGLGDDKNGREQQEIDACKQMIAKYPDFCYQNKKKEREISLFRNSKIIKIELTKACLITDE